MRASARRDKGTRHAPRFAAGWLALSLLALSQVNCGGALRASTTARETPHAASKVETAGASVAIVGSIDADADGVPDAAELQSFGDRENFRRWFTGIAEQQFYEPSKEWNTEQRDCAGLVRFSWREALRAHDRRWLARMGAPYEAFAPDVRAYTLEHSPLGEKLFRTTFGAFRESDLKDDTFSEFADARTLKEFNAEFVSRDRGAARAGDLLFFYQSHAHKYPYHVMIFLGASRVDDEGASDWVVYHTGASVADKGTVKKVRLAVLDHHPDPRWRPLPSNKNFLGFYRLKILQ
ncbi:MAG: uncharacterized protein QOF61_2214 [Acidobacteriota bacterium]|jgi:uncharacterized protein YfaT (DUF1175 family)|nr:uncharacterized protein [Acidobacteriota bacterium]